MLTTRIGDLGPGGLEVAVGLATAFGAASLRRPLYRRASVPRSDVSRRSLHFLEVLAEAMRPA